MLSGEATNTNFIVFGLTEPGLKPTIYRTQGEHANHYATDVVDICSLFQISLIKLALFGLKTIEILNTMF
jgi:hypothetical protein